MTTEQWTKAGGRYDDDVEACEGVLRWHSRNRESRWLIRTHHPDEGWPMAAADFNPSLVEARAMLAMGRSPQFTHTQAEVHAHIRAHGSVEDCEAITPWAKERSDDRCPGCGSPEYSPGPWKTTATHYQWHRSCLARVEARTKAADPVEPAAPRPFRVGDRVRTPAGMTGTITGFGPRGNTHIPACAVWWRGDKWANEGYFTLVTPAPEEPPPTKREPWTCSDCRTLTIGEPDEPTVCTHCSYDRSGDEPNPAPYVHEGATVTNPIGLPIPPRAAMATQAEILAAYDSAADNEESGEYEPEPPPKPARDDVAALLAAREQRYDGPVFAEGDVVEGPLVHDDHVRVTGRVKWHPAGDEESVLVVTPSDVEWWLDAIRCRLITRKEDR